MERISFYELRIKYDTNFAEAFWNNTIYFFCLEEQIYCDFLNLCSVKAKGRIILCGKQNGKFEFHGRSFPVVADKIQLEENAIAVFMKDDLATGKAGTVTIMSYRNFIQQVQYTKIYEDYLEYVELNTDPDFMFDIDKCHVIIDEFWREAGMNFAHPHLVSDMFVSKRVFERRPQTHWIWNASALPYGFVMHLLAFEQRVRQIGNATYNKDSLHSLSIFDVDLIQENLSDTLSLCQQLICPSGDLYLSLPVANAFGSGTVGDVARNFVPPDSIKKMMDNCSLLDFRLITFDKRLISYNDLPDSFAGIGLFHFCKATYIPRKINFHQEEGISLDLAYYNSIKYNGDEYFAQDLWGLRKVFAAKPQVHYDVGSLTQGYVAGLPIMGQKTVLIDVRPVDTFGVENLDFICADASRMLNIEDDSIESFSSHHAPEHFGLGRYNDPVDPESHKNFFASIQRVVKSGGNIYISFPIDNECYLNWNGNRTYAPQKVCEYFSQCEVIEFSYFKGDVGLIENVSPLEYNEGGACGLFHFRRK